MQTKIYFANDVPSAIEVARQELGADALLVNSRPAPAHGRNFGRLEVTFAWDPPAGGGLHGLPQSNGPASAQKAAALAGRTELDEIRRQIALLQTSFGQAQGGQPQGGRLKNGLAGAAALEFSGAGDGGARKDSWIFDRLCEAGLGVETAQEAVREIPRTAADPQGTVVQWLAARIAVTAFPEIKPGESRTLAFVGPPGRGKTTSLVKVAVAEGLARHIPVRIYSVGAHGIGGQEQIARYAAILGVPHQSYESIGNLNLALNGDGWKGLALIDTPGISASDRDEMRDFSRFFSGKPEIEKHLVLRADARSADMLHVISRFSGMQPSRLLFTGLDDALSAGAMAEALIRGGIPGTFAGTGQQIPEDLERVDGADLARDVWVGNWLETPAQSRAAAA